MAVDQHTLASFDAYCSYCMRSLRCIYHAPVHLDHIPHHRFLAMHHLKDPLKTLHKLCQTTLQREQERHHRIHCAQLHGHGRGGEHPADDGHLVSCAAQGSAEALLGGRPSGNRKTPQGQEASEQDGPGGTRVITASQSHGDTFSTSRGQHQMLEPRHGIHGSLEPRFRVDLGRTKDWTNLKEKTAPVRRHLVVTMIDLLLQRFTALTEAKPDSELHKRALQYLLLDTNNHCPFLSWSPEKNPQDDSLRKMSNDTEKAVPFLWTVSHRVAPNLWHLLQRLAFHSSWQLIQVHLRPANLQRSPLAKNLQQQMGKH